MAGPAKSNGNTSGSCPPTVFPNCAMLASTAASPYAHLVALDSATGKVIWDQKIGDYTGAESLTLMPMALRGKIIIGISGAEYGVRGYITAVNADTGQQVWKTYT